MKKIICKKVYDTESAELIKKQTFGAFGDPTGYEESLYKTADGYYFLYVNGGADSKYPKEDIKRVSADKAKQFLD
ncbi:MAG: hypothetical protein IJ308_03045 [Clostridia bacterium]|nr:hypothetical protein [Clostridia bacterium]